MLLRNGQECRKRCISLHLETSLTARRTPDEFLKNWRANFRLVNFSHCHTFLAAVMNQDAPFCGAKVLHPVCLLKTSDKPTPPLGIEYKYWRRAHDAAFATRDTQQIRSRNKAHADHSAKDGVHHALTAW